MKITVKQKTEIIRDLNNALNGCWKQYGRSDSKYYDLTRARTQAYGIVMGFIRTLNVIYEEDELLRALFTDIDGLWDEYNNRCWIAWKETK